MALVTRIARLFQADMHSLLDSIEEPQSILKQAIREMAEAIEQSERQLEDLERRGETLNTYWARHEKSLADTDQQIDLCLRTNNEKLGRSMVRRKLEIQKRVKLIRSSPYSSVFMGIVDGGLCLLGLGAATWAFGATGSAFWAIWCFFLSQSLCALIREQPGRSNRPAGSTPLMEIGRFSAAHKAAEALRELAGSRLGR